MAKDFEAESLAEYKADLDAHKARQEAGEMSFAQVEAADKVLWAAHQARLTGAPADDDTKALTAKEKAALAKAAKEANTEDDA